MKQKFGLKQLILITVFYLVFTLIDVALDEITGVNWVSPGDFNQFLSLIALGLLWIWYFTDKYRRKQKKCTEWLSIRCILFSS